MLCNNFFGIVSVFCSKVLDHSVQLGATSVLLGGMFFMDK